MVLGGEVRFDHFDEPSFIPLIPVRKHIGMVPSVCSDAFRHARESLVNPIGTPAVFALPTAQASHPCVPASEVQIRVILRLP